MYHCKGDRYADLESVRQKIGSIAMRWNNKFIPAILKLAEKSKIDSPELDEVNGKFICGFKSTTNILVLMN